MSPKVEWSEEYDLAPDRPTSPVTVPINEATARAVGKALKATSLPISGAMTAGTAAGIVLSELQHLGYWVIPIPRGYGEGVTG